MSLIWLIHNFSSLIVGLSRSRHEFSLRNIDLASAHDLSPLHELSWNVLLSILRSCWLLILSVLEGALIWRTNHWLVLRLLILIAWFSSILKRLLLILVASRTLHLLPLPRLTSSVIVVIQVLRVDCLRCVGRAPQDKTTTIALPREPLNLPLYRFMDEVLIVARSFLLLVNRLTSGRRTLIIMLL